MKSVATAAEASFSAPACGQEPTVARVHFLVFLEVDMVKCCYVLLLCCGTTIVLLLDVYHTVLLFICEIFSLQPTQIPYTLPPPPR